MTQVSQDNIKTNNPTPIIHSLAEYSAGLFAFTNEGVFKYDDFAEKFVKVSFIEIEEDETEE